MVIKTCIALEDDEIIDFQLGKLKALSCDEKITNIIGLLEAHNYSNAINEIDSYIDRNTGLIVFEDESINALKLELKVFEQKLQALSEQKSEYINDINEFNKDYSFHLGDLIQSILQMKVDLLAEQQLIKQTQFDQDNQAYKNEKSKVEHLSKKLSDMQSKLKALDEFSDEYEAFYEQYLALKALLEEKEFLLNEARKKAKTSFEDAKDKPEYEEAKAESDSFEQENEEVQEEIKASHNLNKEQIKELKKAYRKASKLCHPDIVADDLKEQAHEQMSRLNEAYRLKDLQQVLIILSNLESGQGFEVASDALFDVDMLTNQIALVKQQLEQLAQEMLELENDDTLKLIQEIENRNEYFDSLAEELKGELEFYQRELEGLRE